MSELAQPSAGLWGRWRVRRRPVSFSDLVEVALHPESRSKIAVIERFEGREGRVVDAYWCRAAQGGVALTEKRRSLMLRLIGRTSQTRLHRMTESLVLGEPEFARLLLEIDRYTIRVANVLSGMSRRIALFTLFALTRNILTYLEEASAARERWRQEAVDQHRQTREEQVAAREKYETLKAHRENLRALSSYYDQAAAREAQIVYLAGMLAGFLGLCVVTVLLGLLFTSFDVPGVDRTLFIGCLIAGGIGATMSVLLRMSSGKFNVNHEIGREYLTRLGAFRPAIGAVFALVIYFALQGGLIPQVKLPPPESDRAFSFFLAVGFVVGFSERLAKEMVGHAEGALGGLGGPGESAVPPRTSTIPEPPPLDTTLGA